MVLRTALLLAVLPATCLAAKVGDTYTQVIAEKGKPASLLQVGETEVLCYADARYCLRNDVVVEIRPPLKLPARPADPAAPPRPPPPPAPRPPAGWNSDYAAAFEQARATNRNVLLLFTGSDWCHFCIQLEAEVLATDQFLAYARENLVLVRLDFPRSAPQPPEVRSQNQSLATQFGVRGFPTVIVLAPDGRILYRLVGYRGGGPAPYLESLRALPSGDLGSVVMPPPPRAAAGPGIIVEHPSYLAYLPAGWKPGGAYPLVFALSPGGDARGMVAAWAAVADRHHWLVAASKEFRNGQAFGPSLKQLAAELDAVQADYGVDRRRVILTGISGGGMGAHAVSKFYPGRVRAVVINTGMMYEAFRTDDYPEGKLAVFLASPTDFRYEQMRRDRSFLERHHWRTHWIEFAGGHTLAPAAAYEQAAAWLEANLPD